MNNISKPKYAPTVRKPNHRLWPQNSAPKILVVSPPHIRSMYDDIAEANTGAIVTICDDTKEAIENNIRGQNALIGCPREMFTSELLKINQGSLVWVHNPGAGVEHFMFSEFVNSNITFTNGKIIQGPECADHAIALLLTLTRGLNYILKDGKLPSGFRPVELYRKTAVVIGVGGIGMLISERAAAFGMKVIAVDANLIPMLGMFTESVTYAEINSVLTKADVVFVSAPLTGDSENLISFNQFNSMKMKPILINVSRGGVVDTNALVDALKTNKISACGLDVSNPEPLPDTHPLRLMSNIIISPHIAGLSDHNRQRSLGLMKENIVRFCSGAPLLNVVNKINGF